MSVIYLCKFCIIPLEHEQQQQKKKKIKKIKKINKNKKRKIKIDDGKQRSAERKEDIIKKEEVGNIRKWEKVEK